MQKGRLGLLHQFELPQRVGQADVAGAREGPRDLTLHAAADAGPEDLLWAVPPRRDLDAQTAAEVPVFVLAVVPAHDAVLKAVFEVDLVVVVK